MVEKKSYEAESYHHRPPSGFTEPCIESDDENNPREQADERISPGAKLKKRKCSPVKKRASDYEIQYRFEQLRTRSLVNDDLHKQRFQDIMDQLPFFGGALYSSYSSDKTKEKESNRENNYLEYAFSKFIEESDRADENMEHKLRDVEDLLFSILAYIERLYLDPGGSFDRPGDYPHHPKGLPFCSRKEKIAIEDKLGCIEARSDERDFYINQRLNYLERIGPTVKKYVEDFNIEMLLNPSL